MCSHNATSTHISNSYAPRKIIKAHTDTFNLSFMYFQVFCRTCWSFNSWISECQFCNQITFLEKKKKKILILNKCVCSYHEVESLHSPTMNETHTVFLQRSLMVYSLSVLFQRHLQILSSKFSYIQYLPLKYENWHF